ncbi:uncharacterized protein LOC129407523 [Boleophthalmus pectinirostris]|uniref:uncharacterized protein LOC129407523 n=1 Tax=Boleophthalmus pectinirostris TaxID=150288 RepID=UPI00242FD218|nr:uncharacterized protein LOC129407523 [Boleophthalmus pectinirostris]
MLCVTMMSSLSTVCYLHKHMKNIRKLGISISATRLRSQMRVTITGMFQGVLFFFYGLLELAKEYSMIVVICELITGFTVDCSMVGYVWLNFYYYIQIVPAQSALFHWVKRNIKSTIYVLLVLSSFSTVCYLHKHMKNLGKMGTSFSATRLRSQMRVTITGIFQGVLFFLFASYALCEVFVAEYSGKYIDKYIWFSISTFFISGTTVTLGIGQNVFRQRIIDMYKALKHVSICQKTE